MKTRTFMGGCHPYYGKEFTEGKPIRELEAPEEVVIPLHQHIGVPAKPLVKKGDEVKVGTKIGEADAHISASVHSSVSGTVKAVVDRPHPSGRTQPMVVIVNDGKYEPDPQIHGHGSYQALKPEEIVAIVRDAGIVGLGGAAFPTHVKLAPPADKPVDTLLINGSECEPYLTADHRLMIEEPERVFSGILAAQKAIGARYVKIGIEANKPEAIEVMNQLARAAEGIEVVPLEVKYPQGGEKQLIQAILGKEVPSGGLPFNIGTVVINVGTAAAISEAIETGMPLIQRVVTLTGKIVKEPQNFRVRLGTPISYLLEKAGGTTEALAQVIMGGPMMGLSQHGTDVPIIKGTSGILCFGKNEVELAEPLPCVRCARCVDHCPAGLMPVQLAKFAKKGMLDDAEQYGAMDCIECGTCSYVCPSKIFLVHWIRLVRAEIIADRRKQTG